MEWNLELAVREAISQFDDRDPRFFPGPRAEMSLVLVVSLWDAAIRTEVYSGPFIEPYLMWKLMPLDTTLEQVVEEWCKGWFHTFERPSGQMFLQMARDMLKARHLYQREPCTCGCGRTPPPRPDDEREF